MKWISIKDSLPGEWDHILVCNANEDIDDYKTGVTEATYAPCGKGCCKPRFDSKGMEYVSHEDVTHWMPLPELPKD